MGKYYFIHKAKFLSFQKKICFDKLDRSTLTDQNSIYIVNNLTNIKSNIFLNFNNS